jgi:SAM-dependent methyltransferase
VAEIFTVGSLVGLAGELETLPAVLRVIDPGELGTVVLSGSDDHVEISCPDQVGLGAARTTEAIRMAFRVVQKRWSEAAVTIHLGNAVVDDLAADGFHRQGVDKVVRPPGVLALTGGKAKTSFDSYAHILDVHWNFVPAELPAYEPLLSRAPMRILDLGSGVGKNARVLARHGHRVTAVDAARWAVERSEVFVPEVCALVASATHLPFAAASFDAVLDVGCLHCIPEAHRARAVREISRLLVPGGRLFSRIFKPRPVDWVNRQPFEAARFGLTEDEVRYLLEPEFPDLRWWREDPDLHYLTASRAGAV